MARPYFRNRNEGKTGKNGKRLPPNWEYRFTYSEENGKRKQITKSGFKTKKEAELAGNKAYTEYMECGRTFEPSRMTFAQCIDDWYENYVKVNCNKRTQMNYMKQIKLIKPSLGHYQLQAIDTQAMQTLITELVQKKYTANRLNNVKKILTGTLRYAQRNKWVRYNEALDVQLPAKRNAPKEREEKREPIPKEMIECIFKLCPEGSPAHIPLMLAYKAGLRMGESYGLMWDDIDLNKKMLRVERQVQWDKELKEWTFSHPKYNSKRDIVLDDEFIELLKREKNRQEKGIELQYERNKISDAVKVPQYHYYLVENDIDMGSLAQRKKHGDEKEVFMVCRRDDGSYINSNTMMYYAELIHKKLNFPEFKYHNLRHTHATDCVTNGMNPKELQRRLGHKNISVTLDLYAHATEQLGENSRAILNAMYTQKEEAEK